MGFKQSIIAAGFGLFGATRLHRLSGGIFRGRGVILAFHRVRPADAPGFSPNGLLEITPDFFDRVLTLLRDNNLDIVTLDEAAARLKAHEGAPFAVLTFDDGFRDVVDHALPLLERHDAPFTFYIAPGLAEREARLWWVELEETIRRLDRIELELDGAHLSLPAKTIAEKAGAFERLYGTLRSADARRMAAAVAGLRDKAGVDPRALVESLCLGWPELRALAAHRLATLAAHSLTHPRLAGLSDAAAMAEMAGSRDRLEQETGRKCRHFAYPYGDAASAGPREFALARRLGFETAVTTRPGMIFPEHAGHLLALPRLSVNGLWQDEAAFETLLTGAPFALWNRGRRLNVG
jgi:peptidoglycan/xylan/chitin deacetylase (PgdA/CDA1 family)